MSGKLDPKQIIISNNEVTNAMLTTCIDDILIASEILIDAINNGNKVLWCGNGGSAADSQHMSTELMGGLRNHDRPPIPSIALTTDSSFLTGKNGGKLNGRGDIVINIPSNDTQRIQEGHLLTEHILCEMLETSL